MLRSIRRRTVEGARIHWTYVRNRMTYRAVAHPWRRLWVPIGSISLKLYAHVLPGTTTRIVDIPPGSIIGGDWDLSARNLAEELETNVKYKGIVEHFRDGVPWEETVLFQKRYARSLEERGTYYGCTSLSELAAKYDRSIDRLYDAIKVHGVQPRSWRHPTIAPIYTHIGRQGDFIFTFGGNHRYAIARVLGIERLPVRVWLRHLDWQEAREEADNEGSGLHGTPDLVQHPDLVDVVPALSYRPAQRS